MEGYGVSKNPDKGYELIKRSADQGNADGQAALGWLYQEGYGVPKNLTSAAYWYELSAEQGNSAAQNALGELYAGELD
ncbi:sel1 repeat family protein [Vibrio breoganii]|nr:sel1 repeat family protein [Vibrio breoganii]